jgi:hypothetical protein
VGFDLGKIDLETVANSTIGVGFVAAVYKGIVWVASTWKEGRKSKEQRQSEADNTVAGVFRETLKNFQDDARAREEQRQKEMDEREERHRNESALREDRYQKFRDETDARMDKLRDQMQDMAHKLGEAQGQVKTLSSQHIELFKNQEKEIGTMAGTIAAGVVNKSKAMEKISETFHDAEGVDP